jgi:hypothetical protein
MTEEETECVSRWFVAMPSCESRIAERIRAKSESERKRMGAEVSMTQAMAAIACVHGGDADACGVDTWTVLL